MNDRTPGPWSVGMLSRPQPRPFFVCRQISESHWEQLRRNDGRGIAAFELMEEAKAAADEANGTREIK